MKTLRITEVPGSHSSEPNWPIRVGGVYAVKHTREVPVLQRVTATDGEMVYTVIVTKIPSGGTREHSPDSYFAADFRALHHPGDGGPLPAFRAAANLAIAALEHSVPADCWSTGPATGNAVEDFVVCPGCRALAALRALPEVQ